jgi:hypothetical protein
MKKFRLPSFTAIVFAMAAFILSTPLLGQEVSAGIGTVILITDYIPMPTDVLAMNNTNNVGARESFVHAKKLFFKAFRDKFGSPGMSGDQRCAAWVENLKLSQSEIRIEVQLNAANNIFTFGLTPNQANSNNVQFPTERRLQLQDSLVVQEYGIFVGNPGSQADVEWNLRTYGNTQDFAAAAAAALDGTFYSHGWYLLKCNNDVIMPYRGLFNHWYKPQTQQTAALGAASPGDQIRGAEDGMITTEPNVVLIGSKNYQPQIELPGALAAADAFERAIIIYRGILAQNSTVVS